MPAIPGLGMTESIVYLIPEFRYRREVFSTVQFCLLDWTSGCCTIT
jgi:hypothetical protein